MRSPTAPVRSSRLLRNLLDSVRIDRPNRSALACCVVLLTAITTSCGGGGGTSDTGSPAATLADPSSQVAITSGTSADPNGASASRDEAGFPVASTGIAACPAPADALQFDPVRGFTFDAAFQEAALFERLAHLRCLGGAPKVTREARIDLAASRHAAYSIADRSTGHLERPGTPLYSGTTPGDRLRAAGYTGATWGEVLARTGPLADDAYEGLTAAIYHRLTMLSPQSDEAGVGVREDGSGSMVSVAKYAARSIIATGRVIAYPADGQRNVPVSFDSDREVPDPAPDAGVVGYPVSLQVDRSSTLEVDRFDLARVADGAIVPAAVRSGGPGRFHDPELGKNGTSESFLMPLAPLEADIEYEARFVGRLDGASLTRTWRFRTLPQQPLAIAARTTLSVGEYVRIKLAGCGTRYDWTRTQGLDAKIHTAGWMQVRGMQTGPATLELRDGCGRAQRLDFTVR